MTVQKSYNFHLPKNIKVHFAGCEVQYQYIAAQLLGVKYGLYTCYPFVERMVFGKGTTPIMPLEWQKDNPEFKIPQFIINNNNHVIQDSGLFTLMFGSQSGKHPSSIINKWYDALVEFTLKNSIGATCVEIDCQKILGVEEAWSFRERLSRDIPNRIINVFHLEDGQKGLDRLIEYSDYIAISVPELRFAGKKNWTNKIARYIKSKKPSIDIHLLGCTEQAMLSENKFCTSADSTSWIAGKRFGFIAGKHKSRLITNEIQSLVGRDAWDKVREYNNEENTNFMCFSVWYHKQKYIRACGSQL